MEFVCEMCGAKFEHDWKRRGGNRPRFGAACKAERRQASNQRAHKIRAEKRKAERAEAAKSNKIVRRCRRCGKMFEQTARPRLLTIQVATDAYVLRSYCKSCSWAMQRAARACDSRYVGVGGHSDVLEAGR